MMGTYLATAARAHLEEAQAELERHLVTRLDGRCRGLGHPVTLDPHATNAYAGRPLTQERLSGRAAAASGRLPANETTTKTIRLGAEAPRHQLATDSPGPRWG
jgi:hypothetical protein